MTPGVPAPEGAPKTRKKLDRSIVEGPIGRAVWNLAWPTVLQNAIGGIQGIIDHAMVGRYVGYEANAAVGVSWQIFLVIVVFIVSLFTGMGVLVARFAGANEPEKVDKTVYNAFLTALFLSVGILAPVGYFAAPTLLDLVNASPQVQHEALPYLRMMFVCSIGMLMFFMIGGALRAAGDARTPLYLGAALTVLNLTFNVILIRGWGPIPAMGTLGAAVGTIVASFIVSLAAIWLLVAGRLVIHFPRSMSLKPDFAIIRALFRYGLPAGFQGIAMNIAGVLLLRFIGSLRHSAEAQAAYAVGYAELFALITWTSVGLMGAASAAVGQNLGAGKPERSIQAVKLASRAGLGVATFIGLLFWLIPERLLAIFDIHEPIVVDLGRELLRYLSISGLFITVALTYTGGLQGSGDTRSPLVITLISQFAIPIGICSIAQATGTLQSSTVWTAIVAGHFTRCMLSVARFHQGRWRQIAVDVR
jgi:putative MATE family efflux protein